MQAEPAARPAGVDSVGVDSVGVDSVGVDSVGERLLDTLVSRGFLTANDADRARRMQHRTGSQVETILIALGLAWPREVYRALAEVTDSEYVEADPVLDDDLRALADVQTLVDGRWLPLGWDSDGTLAVATSSRPTAQKQAEIEAVVGRPVRVGVTPDRGITQGILAGHREQMMNSATCALYDQNPAQSARQVVDKHEKWTLIMLGVLVLICAVAWPVQTFVAALFAFSVAFTASIVFKFVVCLTGADHEYDEVVTEAEAEALLELDLPVYTVLVPCYKESQVVRQLVGNLGALNYPADKLQILLLLEEDDEETLAAALSGDLPHTITIVRLPDSLPKTKPKACNIGLALARGEFLVIFDAEDRPEPDQLRKAVAAFDKAGPETVCVQAALNYFNAEENVLTRMFTLEYSFWFDYLLPGLDTRQLPIPLGGTSNHFRTAALRELGGWDPFNVTEDADLGIRAAAHGYRVGVLNSTTYEEANNAYGNWIRQRSRWIKGYLQTVLVHVRRPVKLYRALGLRQSLGFALLIAGTPVSFLAVIPLYTAFSVSLFVSPDTIAQFFPGWLLWLALLNLLAGNSLMIWVTMMGAFRRQRNWLVVWALANPFYWILHSISAYKAVWQLVTRPHYWEKTDHGLTHVAPLDADGIDTTKA